MANAYYTYMAVGSSQEASIFSDEHTWTILDVLRKSGAKGLTASQAHEEVERNEGVSVSRSKIYSLLKRLYELEWVHRYYDQEAQAQRNSIGPIWGGVIIDEEFYSETKDKMKNYIKKNLFPIFEDYLKKAMSDLADDVKTKRW